jgi:hypothetical protein
MLAPGWCSSAGRHTRGTGVSRLQLSGSNEDEAKKEAQKWAEMAARMKVGPEDKADDADGNALRACSDAWARTDIYI